MKKDDLEFHSYLPYGGPPLGVAINVKVDYYIPSIKFPIAIGCTVENGKRVTHYTHPMFTAEWIDDEFCDGDIEYYFNINCESEYDFAQEMAEDIFDEDPKLMLCGRSGGWLTATAENFEKPYVLEYWDAVALAKWAKFKRICDSLVKGIPEAAMLSLYENEASDRMPPGNGEVRDAVNGLTQIVKDLG